MLVVLFAEEFIMRILVTVFITELELYIFFTIVLKSICFMSHFASRLWLLLSVGNLFIAFNFF
jgi:hypothetical protein